MSVSHDFDVVRRADCITYRGYHPFDYDTNPQSICNCPSVYYSETQSDSQYSKNCQCSQASLHKDVIAKRKIAAGEVEFGAEIWDDKIHGAFYPIEFLVTHPQMSHPAEIYSWQPFPSCLP